MMRHSNHRTDRLLEMSEDNKETEENEEYCWGLRETWVKNKEPSSFISNSGWSEEERSSWWCVESTSKTVVMIALIRWINEWWMIISRVMWNGKLLWSLSVYVMLPSSSGPIAMPDSQNARSRRSRHFDLWNTQENASSFFSPAFSTFFCFHHWIETNNEPCTSCSNCPDMRSPEKKNKEGGRRQDLNKWMNMTALLTLISRVLYIHP